MLRKLTQSLLLTATVSLLTVNSTGALSLTPSLSPLLQTAPTTQISPSVVDQLKTLTPKDTLQGCSGAVVSTGPLSNNQYTFDVQWLVKHDLAQVFYYLYINDDQKVVSQRHEGLAGGIKSPHTVAAKYSLPAKDKSKTIKLTVYVTDIWNTIVKQPVTCQVTLTNPNQVDVMLQTDWQRLPLFSSSGTSTPSEPEPAQETEDASSGSGTTQNGIVTETSISSGQSGSGTSSTGSSSGSVGGTSSAVNTGATAGSSGTASSAPSASATSTGTSTGPNEAPQLMRSPDILTCKGTAQTLYFENDLPAFDWMGANCVLSINALVQAGIYAEAYDPKAEDNSGNLIKALSLEELKKSGRLYYSWKGYDDYDQPTEPGKYKLVVEARPGTAFSPDISIHTFVIENSPEAAPQAAEATAGVGAANGTAGTAAAGATAGTASGENLRGAAEEEPSPGLLEQLNQAVFGEGEANKAQETVQSRVASKCPNTFYPTDIAGHPFETLIKKAYDECLVRGYTDGTFRADQGLTRAEATKIIVLASGKVAKQGCYDADCGSPFDDLEMWQGPWVRAAWDLKIVSGIGKNVFAPNRALTRAEAAALTMKAFNIPLHYGCYNAHCGAGLPDDPFNDIVQMWQGPYLRALWDKGVLHTLTPGRFYPDQPITRGQFIELTYLVKSLK